MTCRASSEASHATAAEMSSTSEWVAGRAFMKIGPSVRASSFTRGNSPGVVMPVGTEAGWIVLTRMLCWATSLATLRASPTRACLLAE